MSPTLPTSSATILYDGIADHRFRNPEGVAVDADGRIWCGSSTGWVFRIERDGSSAEAIATTGGFLLGIAFDGEGGLVVSDTGVGGEHLEPAIKAQPGVLRLAIGPKGEILGHTFTPVSGGPAGA